VKARFVRISALALGAIFLSAALLAAAELWRDGDVLRNPKLKIAAGWFVSGAIFLAAALRRRR
jgi:hypothetical protein